MLSRKIGYKLTFGVVLTALLAIGIFAYFNIQSESKSLLTEVERHANQLSEAVKSDTEYDMLHNDRERIHESIRRIGKQESIDRIRVFNKSGEIIYSSDSAEIGKMVDKNAESCYRCHSAGKPLEHLEQQERTRIFRPDRRLTTAAGHHQPDLQFAHVLDGGLSCTPQGADRAGRAGRHHAADRGRPEYPEQPGGGGCSCQSASSSF